MRRAISRSPASCSTSWARASSSASPRAATSARVAKLAGDRRGRLRMPRVGAHPAGHLVQAVGQHDDEPRVRVHRRHGRPHCSTTPLASGSASRDGGSEGDRRRDRLPHRADGQDRIAVTRKLGAFKTSMLQDVEAGKPLEIDALLTVVREIAQRVERAHAQPRRAARLDARVRAVARTVPASWTYCLGQLTSGALALHLSSRHALVLPELARPGGVARAAGRRRARA